MTNLAKLALGEHARITGIGGAAPVKRRLMDMGLVPGEAVVVVKVAPLGDPIEVAVKGYRLSLRNLEAEGITVEVTP
jgi:ferrous iron transport protein A